MHNHWDLENSWTDSVEIWHEDLGWVWDGYLVITLIIFLKLPYFVYLSILFYLCIITGIKRTTWLIGMTFDISTWGRWVGVGFYII